MKIHKLHKFLKIGCIRGTWFIRVHSHWVKDSYWGEIEKHTPLVPYYFFWEKRFWLEIYYRHFRYWVDFKYHRQEKIRRKNEKEFLKNLKPFKIGTNIMKEPIIRWSDMNWKRFNMFEREQ